MNGANVFKFDPPTELDKGESFEYTTIYPSGKPITKKELEGKFKCRICGHEKCEYRFNTDSYVCSGCSAMFEDPEKFTHKRIEWRTRDHELGD